MDIEKRMDLIRQVGEEITTEEELRALLESNDKPIAYDGFEPSGNIHIAQGIMRAINVNKMTAAGCHFKMWVADWFALMNDKLGGDLDKIQTTGKYLIEVWKSAGMDLDNVEFIWSNEVMSDSAYWRRVVEIARLNTVKRITRCAQIMGRSESDALSGAQIFYPCMQASDIFELDADITQLGMDQRKVNMLAREVAPKLGHKKPVVVSHHMLMGLGQPPSTDLKGADRGIEMKMSKSNPNTAIFMTDTFEQIKKKLNKAYCPEGIVDENPVLEYYKYMIFEKFDSVVIERPAKFGGDLEFHGYDALVDSFSKKELHPMDAKAGAAVYIDKMIEPVRNHFEKNVKARKLMEEVQSFQVTK